MTRKTVLMSERISLEALERVASSTAATWTPPGSPIPLRTILYDIRQCVVVKSTEGIRCAKAASKAQREKSGIKAAGCRPAHPYCVTRPRCR